jgi:isocitrate lyase
MRQSKAEQALELSNSWANDPRWRGIKRNYSALDVVNLRPSILIEHTIAKLGAERFWELLHDEPYVTAMGAMNGSQAVQMARAGLKSIYLSGWQVAADANNSRNTYPDQSLYPCNSVPDLVKRLNNALMRADQIDNSEGIDEHEWYLPILADAEAGFGGPVHAFELMKAMIEAGASGVHFEDQLASEKKCGHLGGKVLVPTSQFLRTLTGARLAADVLGVPTLIVARTDALGATLLTSDIDESDRQFIQGSQRTMEGYYQVKPGIEPVIARGLAYAPYADLVWFESSKPNLAEAEEFAKAIHAEFPGKLLAYNCSPSFNWKQNLDDKTIAKFNERLGELGFKYQFITLAGWHLSNLSAFKLSYEYAREGMPAYVRIQEEEFASQEIGYTAVRHQREVGTGYFDKVLMAVTGGEGSTAALKGSTEEAQFNGASGSNGNGNGNGAGRSKQTSQSTAKAISDQIS